MRNRETEWKTKILQDQDYQDNTEWTVLSGLCFWPQRQRIRLTRTQTVRNSSGVCKYLVHPSALIWPYILSKVQHIPKYQLMRCPFLNLPFGLQTQNLNLLRSCWLILGFRTEGLRLCIATKTRQGLDCTIGCRSVHIPWQSKLMSYPRLVFYFLLLDSGLFRQADKSLAKWRIEACSTKKGGSSAQGCGELCHVKICQLMSSHLSKICQHMASHMSTYHLMSNSHNLATLSSGLPAWHL